MKLIKFLFWYIKISWLEDSLKQEYFTKFNKTKRTTLWYMACKNKKYCDSIEYAFYKVYGFWGIDSLTEKQTKGF